MQDAQAQALIDELYEAVGDATALKLALGRLRELFGAQQALIQTSVLRGNQLGVNFAADGVSELSLLEYHMHFESEDVWTRSALERGLIFEGSVARGAELVPIEQLHRTRFWRDFLQRHGVVDMLSGVLEMSAQSGLPPTVITLHRTGNQPLFDAQDEERMRRLLPSLRRALLLQRRLMPRLVVGRTMQELFDQMAVPMGLVDVRAQPLESNRAAEAALAAAEFCRLSGDGGLQWRTEPEGWTSVAGDLERLRVLPGLERLLVSESGAACVACLLAARGSFRPLLHDDPVFALFSLRPLEPQRDAELLRQRFGLSPTELRVALQLMQGLDAEAVAALLQVKLTTVRTHIAALLDKTAADHQLQMLARLQGLA